jgi:hypothetical protein
LSKQPTEPKTKQKEGPRSELTTDKFDPECEHFPVEETKALYPLALLKNKKRYKETSVKYISSLFAKNRNDKILIREEFISNLCNHVEKMLTNGFDIIDFDEQLEISIEMEVKKRITEKFKELRFRFVNDTMGTHIETSFVKDEADDNEISDGDSSEEESADDVDSSEEESADDVDSSEEESADDVDSSEEDLPDYSDSIDS